MSVNDNVLQVSGTVSVTEQLKPLLRAEIRLTRCSISNAAQCEHFNNFTIADFCSELLDSLLFEGQFLTKVEPAFKCPVGVGDYQVSGVELKLDQFAALPIEGFRWTIKLELYHVDVDEEGEDEEKTYLGCIQGQMRVMASSTRRKYRRYREEQVKIM